MHGLRQAGHLSETLPELCRSYIHMHVNRLLRTRHHDLEVAIYDSLVRLYESRLARQPTANR